MDESAVHAAVQEARQAQSSWAQLDVAERCRAVLAFRDALLMQQEELCELLSRETGKPRFESLTHEVLLTGEMATYYARIAPRLLRPRRIRSKLMPHRGCEVLSKPRGVVAIIAPWNYPLIIPLGDVFAALIAGNAVVLKPSDLTPLIALAVQTIFRRLPLHPHLFQVVTGDAATGKALIAASPDALVFTGSVAVGRQVAVACAERLIPCTIELGGKAAMIVCADADIDFTARALVFGAFANSGQICVSVERVFAHAKVYQPLVERVAALAAQLRCGDPLHFDTDIGAMISSRQVEHAELMVAQAVAQGAEIRAGGVRAASSRQTLQPTVLAGCAEHMAVMQEEIFGPVLPIMQVEDEEQAVRLANASPLGLAAYVFGSNTARARRVAARLRAGVVMVNDVLSAYATAEAPFGGVKHSGIGRVHGEEGLRFMCEESTVSYDRLPLRRNPLWFPYGVGAYRGFKLLARWLFRVRATAEQRQS